MEPHKILEEIYDITEKSTLESLDEHSEITEKIASNEPPIQNKTEEETTTPYAMVRIFNESDGLSQSFETLNDSLYTRQGRFHETWVEPREFWKKLKLTLGMIKVQHSIFALPFALASVFVATDGKPPFMSLIMVILAMITARNTAMTFNRIVDKDLDKENPRTTNRELPSGKISLKFATVFCIINAFLFILISSYFNELTLILSPVALLIITGYSLTKRFTDYTQIFLGLALGISPIAAWIAMTGSLSLFPIFLGLGVLMWVAGFDVIYSTMDYEHDKNHNIKNLVVKLGVKNALILAKILHCLSLFFIILGGALYELQLLYLIGCLIVAGMIIYEHSLVKADDLSQVDMAFFTMNGYIAIIFFSFVLLDIYVATPLPF